MSETTTVDATSVFDAAKPDPAAVEKVRAGLAGSTSLRKQVTNYIAGLPTEVGETDAVTAARKGLAFWAVGREVEAAEWLSHADTATAKLFRARALADTGRPGAALELLGSKPADARAARAAAWAHLALGNSDEAEALTDAVAAEFPADGAYMRGRIADLRGDRAGAREAYDEAVSLDEEHALALFRLGFNEYTYGEEDEAITLYRRCLETPCPPVNAYLNLGNIYEDRAEFSKARDCYRAVLSVDANNQRARMFNADAGASINMFYDEDLERRADRRSQVLRLPVTDFELSVRSRNCLAKMGVRTLGDLIQRTEAELLSYKNFGETSLQEIKDILAQKGLRLGMGRDEVAQDDKARSILESIGGAPAGMDRSAVMERPLLELELSVRSRHCMNVLGLRTVGDLIARSEAELMTIKNFGQTSLNEVKQKLAELGVTLASGK